MNAGRGKVPLLSLIPDLAQQIVPPIYIRGTFDSLRRTPVNYAQHAPPLLALRDNNLHRIRRRAENTANLWDASQRIQYIDGITVLHHQHKDVPRSQALGIAD